MNNYYITTSIPYVNGAPHLGHALEFVYADVLARYARQVPERKVLFSTGTDEHGSKIAEKYIPPYSATCFEKLEQA